MRANGECYICGAEARTVQVVADLPDDQKADFLERHDSEKIAKPGSYWPQEAVS